MTLPLLTLVWFVREHILKEITNYGGVYTIMNGIITNIYFAIYSIPHKHSFDYISIKCGSILCGNMYNCNISYNSGGLRIEGSEMWFDIILRGVEKFNTFFRRWFPRYVIVVTSPSLLNLKTLDSIIMALVNSRLLLFLHLNALFYFEL